MRAMSSSRTKQAWSAAGFTLIELLVVLTIIGLLATLAVRAFAGNDPLQARRDRADILRLVNEVRRSAILTGRPVTLHDEQTPKGIALDSRDGALLRWYPDGSALPGTVKHRDRFLYSVDAVTGLLVEAP